MQTIGYITPHGQKIKVLVRPNSKRCCVAMKIRESGNEGQFFEAETLFLEAEPYILKELKDGNVVHL